MSQCWGISLIKNVCTLVEGLNCVASGLFARLERRMTERVSTLVGVGICVLRCDRKWCFGHVSGQVCWGLSGFYADG